MKPLATLTLAMLCMLPADAAPATLPPPAPTVPADAEAVCVRLMERRHRLIRSIKSTADADDATAELRVPGEIMMGLLATPDALQLTNAQQEHIRELMKPKEATAEDRTEINRLKAADFYGSHLLMMSLGL